MTRVPTSALLALALAVPLVFQFAGAAHAQSFDCAKARKPNEFAVCEDGNLARVERSFASAYLQRRARLTAERRFRERQRFRNEHLRNIRRVEACGYNGSCIFNIYVAAKNAYQGYD